MGERRFSKEVRERSARMAFEVSEQQASLWETTRSLADQIGCSSETLRNNRIQQTGARA